MKTIDRYVAGLFLKNLMIAVFAMTTLFLFQAIFADLFDQSYTTQQILFYHWLNVPQIIVQMVPPAVLLATVLTLSGMARTQELVACYAIGIGLRHLMTLLLSVVIVVCCLMVVMQDRILPPIFRMRTNYKWREMYKHPDFFLDVKRDKVWYRSKNMIYNLQRFDPQSQKIFGMSVYTFDENFELIQMIGAESAEYKDNIWKLKKGSVTLFSHENPFPLTKDFDEKEIYISETPKDFQEIEKEVDGLKFKELSQYIERMKAAGANIKAYEVKFHSKLSLSFIPIVMCFLAVPFSLGGRREGSLAKDLALCLAITFFYWLFYSVGLSLGTNGALPPWLAAWLPSTIFVVLAAVLITRKL